MICKIFLKYTKITEDQKEKISEEFEVESDHDAVDIADIIKDEVESCMIHLIDQCTVIKNIEIKIKIPRIH